MKNQLGLTMAIMCMAVATGGCEDDGKVVWNAGGNGIVGDYTETGYTEWTGVVGVDESCTGILIDPEVVLTADHCVWGSLSGIGIQGGANMELDLATTVGGVTSSDDVVLLKISPALDETECYGIKTGSEVAVGTDGWVVGYGTTEESGADVGFGVHRKGQTAVLDVSGNIMELGGAANHCSGDSGGPFFVDQDDEWVAAGVTSYGESWECPAAYGGFSESVFYARNWIDNGVMELTGHSVYGNGCGSGTGDADTDADSDADSDADTDSDTDADTDSDTPSSDDTDPGETGTDTDEEELYFRNHPSDSCGCTAVGQGRGSGKLLPVLLSVLG